MSQEHKINDLKQQRIDDAVLRLKHMGVEFSIPDRRGVHIIVRSPQGDRIDLWPSTERWQRQGQPSGTGMKVFWKAIETWGAADGA